MGLFSQPLAPYTGEYPDKFSSPPPVNFKVFRVNFLFFFSQCLLGTHDIEVPVETPESFGTGLLLRSLQPALLLETTLVTLFYPAVEPTKSSSKSHMNWLPRPISQTASGYSHFLNKSKWLILPLLYVTAGGTQIPAFVDAPLADKKFDKRGNSNLSSSGEKVYQGGETTGGGSVGSTSEGTLVGDDESNQFPLIVFSHGLGGGRTTYTQYCGELASRGYIVAVIESRDGSGPVTVVRKSDGTQRIVEYIKPEDLLFKPPHPILSQIDFRKEQLTMRTAEVTATLDLMKRINAGDGSQIGRENMRRDEKKGKVDFLENWKGRVNMVKDVTMAGHSFGGATTLQVLRAGKTYPFTRGITLDPWIDPIPPISSSSSSSSPKASVDSPEELGTDINVPLLVFNSEAFTLWSTHYSQVRKITEGVKEDASSWLMTLVGSIHLSFSDFPLIQPFIAKKAGARIDSKEAMKAFVEASEEFLKHDYEGKILGSKVIPGDEEGTRKGEGYKQRGGHPMEKVGEIRMHVTPTSSH